MSNEPSNPEPTTTWSSDEDPGSSTATETVPPPPQYGPAPAAPRRHRRSRPAIVLGIIAALLGSLLLAAVGVLVIAVAAIAAIASGNFDADAVEIELTPTTVADIPASIVEDDGEITIDLTSIPASQWTDGTAPVELDVNVDYGSITVIVPDGIDVAVDASVDVGEAMVFGNTSNGFSNDIEARSGGADAEPDLQLDIDLDIGSIEVSRG